MKLKLYVYTVWYIKVDINKKQNNSKNIKKLKKNLKYNKYKIKNNLK